MSLKAIAAPAALEPGPLVTRCRSLTVAKVDSIGFVAQVAPVLRRGPRARPRRRNRSSPPLADWLWASRLIASSVVA
jgi:hypothetical protein